MWNPQLKMLHRATERRAFDMASSTIFGEREPWPFSHGPDVRCKCAKYFKSVNIVTN